MIGGGERGQAPGSPWDGDKMIEGVGVCLLEAMELVGEVDQRTDEERAEKIEPSIVVLVGECSCSWSSLVGRGGSGVGLGLG